MLKIQPKERLPIFFSVLDLCPYAKKLRSSSPRGADGHCREGILRALLAAPLEHINTFTALHHRFDTDFRFRYQCGLPLDREAPSISMLSRVFKEITEKNLAKQLFEDLVKQCLQDGIIDGDHVAIDSAAIHAYEKKQSKKKSEKTGNANWGADGDYLKFRCPHATGKVDCPLGMTACSASNYGMVVKVDAKDDLRRYCSPHRDTKRWKELYNERTSVERCNSRMKTYLTADDMHVWGIQKVKTHQYINAIVLLVSALSAACRKNQTAA